MKKILLLIFCLVILFVVWYVFGPKKESPTIAEDTETILDSEIVREGWVGDDLIGLPFTVPGVEQEIIIAQDIVDYKNGDSVGSVIYLPEHAVRVNTESKDFIVAPFAANTGGSGTFVYLVLYVKEAEKYIQADSFLLGDRIKLEKVSSVSGGVEVVVYDRLPDEPYSAMPTQKKYLSFIIMDGKLQAKTNSNSSNE
ncbi:MAG: hypothetical protein AAB821_00835 [Patescibacteria group bacterium]